MTDKEKTYESLPGLMPGLVEVMWKIVDHSIDDPQTQIRIINRLLNAESPKDVSVGECRAEAIEAFNTHYLPIMDKHFSAKLSTLEEQLTNDPMISPERKENFLRDLTTFYLDVRRFGVSCLGHDNRWEWKYLELKHREKALMTTMKSLSRGENLLVQVAQKLLTLVSDGTPTEGAPNSESGDKTSVGGKEAKPQELSPKEPAETEPHLEGHKGFLAKIASTVHRLVQEELNKKQFQKQLRVFRKLRDEFGRVLKEAQEAAIADPTLRYDCDDVRDKDRAPPKPPKEGYEVERYHVLDTPPKGFWRPPLPFNPDAWLSRFECQWAGLVHPPAEEPRDKPQMRSCEYALLATIHDEALDIPACDRLTDSGQDDWVKSLWSGVSQEGTMWDDIATLPDRQTYIETALSNVKADLAERTATEAEQKNNVVIRKRGKTAKTDKLEPRFKPWTNPGGARLVIDKQRVKFYHCDNIEDLKIKNDSQAHNLLFYLTSGSMRPKEIKDAISPNTQVTAAKIVEYANEMLNKRVRAVGFTCLPDYDVEFIKRDNFGDYVSTLPMQSKEDFESWQREQMWQ